MKVSRIKYEVDDQDDSNQLQIDEDIVLKKFVELRPDKSSGCDGIYPELLKECAHTVDCKPSHRHSHYVIRVGQIPADWKRLKLSKSIRKDH